MFNEAKSKCRDCYVGKTYNKVVLSDGNTTDPKVLICGECPGADEISQGKPFVGKAGKLLRSTLNKYGFRKTNSLITNTIPCRPEGNKFPKEDDLVKTCVEKWLMQEIELTSPQYVLLIGSTPLKYVLKLNGGITANRGKWFYLFSEPEDDATMYMPTYHPSYVLRKMYMAEGKQILESFEKDIENVAITAGIK